MRVYIHSSYASLKMRTKLSSIQSLTGVVLDEASIKKFQKLVPRIQVDFKCLFKLKVETLYQSRAFLKMKSIEQPVDDLKYGLSTIYTVEGSSSNYKTF